MKCVHILIVINYIKHIHMITTNLNIMSRTHVMLLTITLYVVIYNTFIKIT